MSMVQRNKDLEGNLGNIQREIDRLNITIKDKDNELIAIKNRLGLQQ